MKKFELNKRFNVTVKAAKFGEFKKGDKTAVGIVLAADWYKADKIELDSAAKAYIAEHELEEMFGMTGNDKNAE